LSTTGNGLPTYDMGLNKDNIIYQIENFITLHFTSTQFTAAFKRFYELLKSHVVFDSPEIYVIYF